MSEAVSSPRCIPGLATLITDGSWDPSSGAAGWAGRLIFEGSRHTWHGRVRRACRQSYEPEIIAVANSLFCSLREDLLPHGTKVLCQLDNTRSLALLASWSHNGWKGGESEIEREAMVEIRRLARWHGLVLIPRHIKGHLAEGQREKRHHVHEVLDKLAKQARTSGPAAAQQERKENGTD